MAPAIASNVTLDNRLALLSRLWLHEPDAEILERAANELHIPSSTDSNVVANLAIAYTDLFLLNVFPYGSAFTDRDGELNGASALLALRAFEEQGFQPPELHEVAAADHTGLCLAFIASANESDKTSTATRELFGHFAFWAPVCCLAVEREPGGEAHEFYRSLGARTRAALLERVSRAPSVEFPHEDDSQGDGDAEAPEEEVRLSDVLRFLLAPARCGIFLSRGCLGHMGLQLGNGIRLPFGTRYEVARNLFTAAGESGLVNQLLDLIAMEILVWEKEYHSLAAEFPVWAGAARIWTSRTDNASARIAALRKAVDELLPQNSGE